MTGTGTGRIGGKTSKTTAVGKTHDRLARTSYGLSRHFFPSFSAISVYKQLGWFTTITIVSGANFTVLNSERRAKNEAGVIYHVMMGIYKANKEFKL